MVFTHVISSHEGAFFIDQRVSQRSETVSARYFHLSVIHREVNRRVIKGILKSEKGN